MTELARDIPSLVEEQVSEYLKSVDLEGELGDAGWKNPRGKTGIQELRETFDGWAYRGVTHAKERNIPDSISIALKSIAPKSSPEAPSYWSIALKNEGERTASGVRLWIPVAIELLPNSLRYRAETGEVGRLDLDDLSPGESRRIEVWSERSLSRYRPPVRGSFSEGFVTVKYVNCPED